MVGTSERDNLEYRLAFWELFNWCKELCSCENTGEECAFCDKFSSSHVRYVLDSANALDRLKPGSR